MSVRWSLPAETVLQQQTRLPCWSAVADFYHRLQTRSVIAWIFLRGLSRPFSKLTSQGFMMGFWSRYNDDIARPVWLRLIRVRWSLSGCSAVCWLVTSSSYVSSRAAPEQTCCMPGTSARFPRPSSHVSVCRPACTCGGSQRHRNLLRIHQWQAAAFLINSVWSSRCIRPHFAQSGSRARWICKGWKGHFYVFLDKTRFQDDC